MFNKLSEINIPTDRGPPPLSNIDWMFPYPTKKVTELFHHFFHSYYFLKHWDLQIFACSTIIHRKLFYKAIIKFHVMQHLFFWKHFIILEYDPAIYATQARSVTVHQFDNVWFQAAVSKFNSRMISHSPEVISNLILAPERIMQCDKCTQRIKISIWPGEVYFIT